MRLSQRVRVFICFLRGHKPEQWWHPLQKRKHTHKRRFFKKCGRCGRRV